MVLLYHIFFILRKIKKRPVDKSRTNFAYWPMANLSIEDADAKLVRDKSVAVFENTQQINLETGR